MKFEQSLVFNAVPEWTGHYLQYQQLKAAIYRIERDALASQPLDTYTDEESLLGHESTAATDVFARLLDAELSKISDFYADKEKELLGELQLIIADLKEAQNSPYHDALDEDDDDEDSDTAPTKSSPELPHRTRRSSSKRPHRALSHEGDRPSIWSSNTDFAVDTRITFKLRLQSAYRDLSQLQQFVSLNYTGFRKILKKFDKITESNLQKPYMATKVDKAFPFASDTKSRLDAGIQTIVPFFARIATAGDEDLAITQLKTVLREHVVWERNTIWREMIGLERKGWSRDTAVDKPLVLPSDKDTAAKPSIVNTPVGRLRIPSWVNKQSVGFIISAIAFVAVISSNMFDRPEERNCLAILVVGIIFWALEIIPLFVTALSIPVLVVMLRVIRSTDGTDTRLSATDAAKYIFSQMLTGTIILLIGGFTLAAALSKQNIDKVLASRVLAFAGTKPNTVLLAYMSVACFASMLITNVAAPVLCFSLLQPILRTLPNKSNYSKALILGIALASNIGGQASPIASPQNLIALSYMSPQLSWLQWFAIALPVAGCSVVAIWMLLVWSLSWEKDIVINPVKKSREKFTTQQWFVCFITALTVALLCVEHQIEGLVGDMGIVALIPLIAFFGSGVLRKSDFDNFPWSIVFLAMGGISLGKAVLSSGLLNDIDHLLERMVRGLDIWPILAVFSVLCLCVSTGVSHTIAAVLIVPIAAQIGSALEEPHPRLLIMATALICSAGMGLPVSGFPNLMAINLEDEVGNRYLAVEDFLKIGIPSSLVATAIIITVGYLLMRLLGL